jgi:ubiquinone/menaquinone biosynthesis C-methylase UbiE
VNKQHLEFCSGEEWANAVRQYIIPGALGGVELGDDLLEVGPGPGRTTEILRTMTAKLTAAEVDQELADALTERMRGTNVEVVHADGTALPFPDGRFSAAVCFIMLHHVPTPAQQDQLLAEMCRVVRAGGTVAGVDSLDSDEFRAMHEGDICVPIPPDTFASRLERAGFTDVAVDVNPFVVQFRARAT